AFKAIDAFDPDLVALTPLVAFHCQELEILKAARSRGIPTILPVASWDNLTNKSRLKVVPDRVALWNEAMAEEAVRLHGVPRDRINITGSPIFDQWFERAPTRDRASLCSALGFDPDRPLILYTCSSESIAGPNEADIVAEWAGAIRASGLPLLEGCSLLVRPHPMAPRTWLAALKGVETAAAPFEGTVVWPASPRHPVFESSRADFFDALYHADLVVGLNTSVMVEAAIVRKPVLTFLSHASSASQTGNIHFAHLANARFVKTSENLAAHARDLAAVLRDTSSWAEACDRFVATFIRPLGRDVKGADAVAEVIINALAHSLERNSPRNAP
ncbi:hypothetical protein WDZ92_28060, partial [Nostoc sp. NIES-2111]